MSGAVMAASPRGGPRGPTDGRQRARAGTDRIIGGALRRFGRIDTLVTTRACSLLLESSPGITGKILRIDGTPNGQATSRETAG